MKQKVKILKFNNHGTALLTFFFMVLGSGCGAAKSIHDLPESLPNAMVPVEQTAEEASLIPDQPSTTTFTTNAVPTSTVATSTEANSTENTDFKLTDTSLFLGMLDKTTYETFQKKWVGSTYPACNFFLITALCESDYCKKSKPFYKAGDFDIFLLSAGFTLKTLQEVKSLFESKTQFDLVFQKSNPIPGKPGHVMVGVGYDQSKDRLLIAQGNLNQTTNEVKSVNDAFLLRWQGGFNFFVRTN